MAEPRARDVLSDAMATIRALVAAGLANDYNNVVSRRRGSAESVEYSTFTSGADLLSDVSYAELYESQLRDRLYAIRMLDGALLQINYRFISRRLERHRLAYLPSPLLVDFDDDPSVYIADELWADAVDHRQVPVPIRFDYDDRSSVFKPGVHPKSHVTLGQHKNCRIPVTAPISASSFVGFVTQHFYAERIPGLQLTLPSRPPRWTTSIDDLEKGMTHMVV